MIRSLLFVPSKEKMLKKIGVLGADAYIVDLEDSIEEENKEKALYLLIEFLNNYSWEYPLFVRLNADSFEKDVKELKQFSKIGFVLPKFEDADFYEVCEDLWEQHTVIALIETPKGIVNIGRIAECEWVDSLAFGAEDYSSCTNIKNENEFLRYPKGCILTYAKAFNKQVYDTPSFNLGLTEAFYTDVRESVNLGFDGKMAISPKHIEFINDEFNRFSEADIFEIVKKFKTCGDAVQVINGKVYEKPHIDHLKKLLEEKGKSYAY